MKGRGKSNKELLKLAAKAAGICPHTRMRTEYFEGWGSARYCAACGENNPSWDPLTSDGDALRLAVACSALDLSAATKAIIKEKDVRGMDINALVRLAIVRAAAEIGRVMP